MKLSAIMTLNAAGFTNPLNTLRSALGSTVGQLAALAGVTASVAGALAGIKRALDFGSEMSDMAAVTGMAVDEMVVLRQALQDTGVGAGSLRTVVSYLQRSLSGINEDGGQTGDVFKQLGLDMETLRGMTTTQQIDAIGKALSGLGNESDRTAAVMAIFGRSGAMMKSFFASPTAIETAKKSLGGMPSLLAENANLFDGIADAMGRVKAKGSGLFVGIAAGLAPALKSATDAIDGIDLSGFGLRIGESISMGLEILRSGQAGDILKQALEIGFKGAINTFATGMQAVGVGVLAIFSDAGLWKSAWAVATSTLQAAFMGVVGTLMKVFSAPIVYLRSSMDKIVGELFEALGRIPGVGRLLGIEDFSAKSIGDYMAENEQSVAQWSDAFLGAASTEIAEAGVALQDLKREVGELFSTVAESGTVEIFDVSGLRAQLDSQLDQIAARVRARREELAAAAGGAAAGGGQVALNSVSKGKFEVSSDRLAKIGLFVGGSGASMDYARRTTRATERTAAAVERWLGMAARGAAPVAVWGA